MANLVVAESNDPGRCLSLEYDFVMADVDDGQDDIRRDRDAVIGKCING